jgi:hypothetical protein
MSGSQHSQTQPVYAEVPKERPWLSALLFSALCIAVAFATRCSYLHRGFYRDDYDFLKRPALSFSGVLHAFNPVSTWFYRPIFLIWFDALNTFAPHNSVVMHAASLVLFGLTIALAGMLVFRLTGSALAGLTTSVLFLYGMHMEEAIWWISSGSTLLAALFSLVTLYSWLIWRETGRRAFLSVALLTMAMALCSKEDAASLPLIVIVFDWYLIKRLGITRTFRSIATIWVRILLLMAVYAALDLTAYHYTNVYSHQHLTNLWHGLDLQKLQLTLSFGARTMYLNQFGGLGEAPVGLLWVFLPATAYLLYRARRIPLLFNGALITVIGFLPSPLSSGVHSLSQRFAYVPNLYGAILAGLILFYAFMSESRLVKLTGFTLALSAVAARMPEITILDPMPALAISAFIPVVCYVAWRCVKGVGGVCLLVGILSIMMLICDFVPPNVNTVLIVGVVGGLCGYLIGREVLMGAIFGILAWSGGPVFFVLILAFACFMQLTSGKFPGSRKQIEASR